MFSHKQNAYLNTHFGIYSLYVRSYYSQDALAFSMHFFTNKRMLFSKPFSTFKNLDAEWMNALGLNLTVALLLCIALFPLPTSLGYVFALRVVSFRIYAIALLVGIINFAAYLFCLLTIFGHVSWYGNQLVVCLNGTTWI